MTKSKYTKRALFSSVIALLLCVAMLLGTTFAWFTDSTATGSMVIQSGTLDVVLEMWDGEKWVDAEGETLSFTKANEKFGSDVILEPGCTYTLPKIRVRNAGNLSAYAIVKILGLTGQSVEVNGKEVDLMDVLEVKTAVSNSSMPAYEGAVWDIIRNTPDGDVVADWALMAAGKAAPNSKNTDTSAEFTISVHMKEDAGNEYQGLTLNNVAIAVVATQTSGEYDSVTNMYDKDAVDAIPGRQN